MKSKKTHISILKKLVFVMLIAVMASCDNLTSKELYTQEECTAFKKGDTIFTKEFYTVKRQIILNNYPNKELIEVRDMRYEWDVSIFSYKELKVKIE